MKAILLVDHGSRLAEANAQLEKLADHARGRLPGWLVWTAHLEVVEPDVPTAIDACVAGGAEQLVIAPYFLSPGRHTKRDLPKLIAAARARHPGVAIALAEPLGFDERIATVAIERALAASEHRSETEGS